MIPILKIHILKTARLPKNNVRFNILIFRWRALCVASLSTLLFALALPAFAAIDEADLLPVDEAFQPELKVEADKLLISFKVAPGYYLYQERIEVQPLRAEEVVVGTLDLPKGEPKEDEFFGKMHVYHGDFAGSAALSYPGAMPTVLAFKIKYQGCADAGVCYPPQTRTFAMDVPVQTISGVTEALPRLGDTLSEPITQDPLGLTGPVSTLPQAQTDVLPQEQAFIAEAILSDADTVLLRISAPPDYYLYKNKFRFDEGAGTLALTPSFPVAKQFNDPEFGAVDVYFGGLELPLKLLRAPGQGAAGQMDFGIEFQGCKQNSVCYPIMRRVIAVALPETKTLATQAAVDAAKKAQLTLLPVLTATTVATPSNPIAANFSQSTGASVGLFGALLLALLGGVILNLMPCVLPVLSLKVLGLAESAHSQQAARKQAIYYTLGVLCAFLLLGISLLALKSAGNALGWGFQLQNPLVVGALALVMFVMGLNLSGIVSFGNSLGNLGAKYADAGGNSGAFFTGVLACVVASPCTGPFMATALTYGFTQNSAIALLILLTLGLGLALPFLLIGFIPGLASRLPKPGAWMETLKQWLAFPLYATAIWLAWVFGNQTGVDGLGLLLSGFLLIAAAAWWWERQNFSTNDSTALARAFAIALALGGLLLLKIGAEQSAKKAPTGDVIAQIAQLHSEGEAIFVDVTADWCVTCKVNERNAIDTDAVRAAMEKYGVNFMVVDYTTTSPTVDQYLKDFKAVGVPLYVVYPKASAKNPQPFVLPQILTQAIVLDAIARTSN
jgi:thiol:disulfide interchange protein